MRWMSVIIACLSILPLATSLRAIGEGHPKSFVVRVTDQDSGRPVPLVEFRTTHQARYVTDNAGVVTVADPELLGREVWFHITSHGYEVPKDGFGNRGKRLLLEPGGEAVVKIKRLNIAERLYRITGAGRFDHSLRAGLEVPDQDTAERSGVFGCDSVLNAVYRGRLFWIWGDTNAAHYPLGNFHSTGATSTLAARGGRDPDAGIDLEYYTDARKSFVKEIAHLPGEGPTWLTGLTSLRDKDGGEHLVANYQKVRKFLDVYETGLCEFDDKDEVFKKVMTFAPKQKLVPRGHPFRYEDKDGHAWILYGDPLPTMKIRASYEAWKDPSHYMAATATSDFADQKTGKRVQPHRGSIAWNDHRRRWTMIFTERKAGGDTSRLGEVWYAEARSPFGPWNRCVKVATHRHYSFYNPKQHPYFARKEGEEARYLYFEGTYTKTFSRAAVATPKYDYNQILYRLDLDDDRLKSARAK
jgi:hypothetical protein